MEQNLSGKKRKVNVPVIVGVVVLVLAATAVGLYIHAQRNVLDRDGMVYTPPDPGDPSLPAVSSFEIRSAGGELGGHEYWEVFLTAGGQACARVTSQATHSDREKVTARTVDREVLERITAIVDAKGMTGWDDLPASEIFALDAPSTSVSLVYRGETHGFGDGDELPAGGWAAVREIQALIEAAAGVK